MSRRFNYREAFTTPRGFRSGEEVYQLVDPRHVGRIVAVLSGEFPIRVRWENGWKSDHRANELEREP